MRNALLLSALGAVFVAWGCGAGPLTGDDGAQTGGTGGGNPQGGAGGKVTLPPEDGTGQYESAANSNAPRENSAGAGSILNPDACATWTQQPVVLQAVVAGANANGSAIEARQALSAEPSAQSPVPSHVRTQDFLNHYRPEFPEPQGSAPEVVVQLKPNDIPAQFDLLVAIRTPKASARPKVSLTIVVDNTTSLADGLEKTKRALLGVTSVLQAGDTVQWVSAAPDSPPQRFEIATDAGGLADAIGKLVHQPETSVSSLLETAYVEARAHRISDGINRVLLVSDGADDPTSLPQLVTDSAQPGESGDIRLTALGVGQARTNGHRTLRTASRLGRGAYFYLDTEAEADLLAGRFAELFEVAIDEVRLALTVPWYFSIQRPFVGDVTPTLGDTSVEPQYVAPGGAMSFLFRLESCSPTAHFDHGGTIDAHFTWVSPIDREPGFADLNPDVPTLVKNTGATELTKLLAVASYADALRSLDTKRLQAALFQVQAAAGTDTDLNDIANLLGKHPALGAQ